MEKRLNENGRAYFGALVFFALVALVALPLAMVLSADITPGYTFTSGEQNVTHTKLNNSASGSINTSFYSSKSSAGANPNTAFQILLRDTSLDVFKRSTLAEAVFDHSSFLAARTAKTTPVIADALLLEDSAAASALKRITVTNFLFGGASVTAPGNETRFPALRGGALGSIALTNLMAELAAHSLATNGDLLMTLTENGREVKQLSLQSLFTTYSAGTNYSGNHLIVSWDGTRLRANRATNLVDGLTVTNTVATTNDAFVTLQSGQLKKTFLDTLRTLMRVQNVVQSTYTGTTNIAGSSGNWSNVTAIGTSSLSNNITPSATSSKILVRLVMSACAAGNSQPGTVRIMRDGSAIGTGDSDGASRTEASASIPLSTDQQSVVFEWLDSPATTSAVKYNIEVKATTSTTIYINRSSGDSNAENNARTVSSLTLTEVFQ